MLYLKLIIFKGRVVAGRGSMYRPYQIGQIFEILIGFNFSFQIWRMSL